MSNNTDYEQAARKKDAAQPLQPSFIDIAFKRA